MRKLAIIYLAVLLFYLPLGGRGSIDSEGIQDFGQVQALQTPAYKEQASLEIIPITPVQWGQATATRYGWNGDQWDCLYRLWVNESGWNPYAVNSSSGAAGIAQSLGHGEVILGDSKGQTEWGASYIQGRYGNPCNALAFWNAQSPHYY